MTKLQTETITYSKTHLVINDEISFEEWGNAVATFARLGDCWQWWLGDLLKFGEDTWGEMYAQALDSTQMKYQTLANLKWVANAFPPHRRREGVSWTHHREIASVDNTKKQDQLLEFCEKKGLSKRKLLEHLAKETEGMLGRAENAKNTEPQEVFLPGEKNSINGGEDSGPIPHDAAPEDLPKIDLTDRTTKRNFDKTIGMLDNMLKLRIPNMFLKGTAVEEMVIDLRQLLLEAADA